jgi:hypothetical protein
MQERLDMDTAGHGSHALLTRDTMVREVTSPLLQG